MMTKTTKHHQIHNCERSLTTRPPY